MSSVSSIKNIAADYEHIEETGNIGSLWVGIYRKLLNGAFQLLPKKNM